MCCCGTPIINGQMGYKWQPGDSPSIRQTHPPILQEGEVLLYDEPGRCGGLDAHCHHYRLVKWYSSIYLLVQHGGGSERIRLSTTQSLLILLDSLDTHTRYWLCHALYHAYREGKEQGAAQAGVYWQQAAIEKRIVTRKQRGTDRIKVWVKPKDTCHA